MRRTPDFKIGIMAKYASKGIDVGNQMAGGKWVENRKYFESYWIAAHIWTAAQTKPKKIQIPEYR